MDDDRLVRLGALLLAAIGGSITSRPFSQWKAMGRWEIVFNLVVSGVFSVIAGPTFAELIAQKLFDSAPGQNWTAFSVWLCAAASVVLIPLLIDRARKIGDSTKEDAK